MAMNKSWVKSNEQEMLRDKSELRASLNVR